jgi:hypothetical protein
MNEDMPEEVGEIERARDRRRDRRYNQIEQSHGTEYSDKGRIFTDQDRADLRHIRDTLLSGSASTPDRLDDLSEMLKDRDLSRQLKAKFKQLGILATAAIAIWTVLQEPIRKFFHIGGP